MAGIGILDDDDGFVELISALVSSKGHEPIVYRSAGKLLDSLARRVPDLLVLDVRLPGMDGIELVRLLRRSPQCGHLPIIVVTAEETRTDSVVRGMEDGADEYFAKPLDQPLLLARIDSLLQRGSATSEALAAGPLRVALEERQAYVRAKPVELRHLEFDLLVYFMRHAGRMITRQMLLQSVWNQPADVATRTVDKHVENLRKKLGPAGSCIETVIGAGYVFKPSESSGSRK